MNEFPDINDRLRAAVHSFKRAAFIIGENLKEAKMSKKLEDEVKIPADEHDYRGTMETLEPSKQDYVALEKSFASLSNNYEVLEGNLKELKKEHKGQIDVMKEIYSNLYTKWLEEKCKRLEYESKYFRN